MTQSTFGRVLRRWSPKRVLRRWFPKRYCLRMLRRAEDEHKDRLAVARSLPLIDQRNLKAELDSALWEWFDWLQEIDDKKLIKKAHKMEVYLDDIPTAQPQQTEDDPHYETRSRGNTILRQESREVLIRKIHERAPTYRKERREVVELYIKIGTLAATLIIGVLGALIGLVASFRK